MSRHQHIALRVWAGFAIVAVVLSGLGVWAIDSLTLAAARPSRPAPLIIHVVHHGSVTEREIRLPSWGGEEE